MTRFKNGYGSFTDGDILDEDQEIVLDDTWVEEKELDKARQRKKSSDSSAIDEAEYSIL